MQIVEKPQISKIPIRTFSGKKYEIDVNEDSSIKTIKEPLSKLLSISPDLLSFIYKKQVLDDNILISSLGIDENSFLICFDNSIHKIPSTNKLTRELNKEVIPPQDIRGKNIPFNIDDLTKFISSMQFTKEQAIAALTYTGYDTEETISLLLYGKAIGIDGKKHSVIEKTEDVYSYEDESIAARNNINQINQKIMDLPDDELSAVKRLKKMFPNLDISTIYQLFMASEKDEKMAMSLLSDFK
ncbi:hypothetical protein GPJ56_000885 [Histomonas meleagridis]|nr:hypothetical protein GPJ56_000885 [Histomonas meleagridis]